VLKDERVMAAIQQSADLEARENTGSETSSGQEEEENEIQDESVKIKLAELIKKHQSRAYKILKEMGSNLNDILLR